MARRKSAPKPSIYQLSQNFEALPSHEKIIVYLVSIFPGNLTRRGMRLCLEKAGARLPSGRRMGLRNVDPAVNRMREAGFVHPIKRLFSGSRFAFQGARLAVDKGWYNRIKRVINDVRARYTSVGKDVSEEEIQLWDALVLGNHQDATNCLEPLERVWERDPSQPHPLFKWFANPFSGAECNQMPYNVRLRLLRAIYENDINKLTHNKLAFDYLNSMWRNGHVNTGNLDFLMEWHLLKGNLKTALNIRANLPKNALPLQRGMTLFNQGNIPQALAWFKHANNASIMKNPLAVFYYLASVLHNGSPLEVKEGIDLCSTMLREPAYAKTPLVYSDYEENILKRFWLPTLQARLQYGKKPSFYGGMGKQRAPGIWEILSHAYDMIWYPVKYLERYNTISDSLRKANKAGYYLIAGELFTVVSDQSVFKYRRPTDDNIRVTNYNHEQGIKLYIAQALPKKDDWEKALEQLTSIKPTLNDFYQYKSKTDYRLIWVIGDYNPDAATTVYAQEQKRSRRGWQKVRSFSYEELATQRKGLAYFTRQDHYISDQYRRQSNGEYNCNLIDVLKEMVDHPLIFRGSNTGPSLTIANMPPQIRAVYEGDFIRLEIYPKDVLTRSYAITDVSPERLEIVLLNEDQKKIADVLGKEIKIPGSQLGRIQEVVEHLSSMLSIQPELAENLSTHEVDALEIIHIHLKPKDGGLSVSAGLYPLGERGPFFKAGLGQERIKSVVNGRNLETLRNLQQEAEDMADIIRNCPTLARQRQSEPFEWFFPQLEDCLNLVLEIKELGDTVVVFWPKDKPFTVSEMQPDQQLSIKLKKSNDWFEATGELVVDEGLTLVFGQLLMIMDTGKSRYLQLAEDRFLALTESFQKAIKLLQLSGEVKEDRVQISPSAALALQSLNKSGADIQGDQHWQDYLDKVNTVMDARPEFPQAFNGEPRPYQLEGFQWLWRLSHLGFGACLADDMGLGKTFQALALVQSRANQGPTLVVAPTSVTRNWQSEAERFTPTLNPILFANAERQETLDKLGPNDVVICTYGLLTQDAEMLTSVKWNTVILDEAQAIKNPSTQRARAAIDLQADFRMVLTGTPVENHMGELWSLFRFLNPQLFGNRTQFNRNFAIPIERGQDDDKRGHLKRLIQPFILRRLKENVLTELPPKTEIPILIDMHPEEAALYEAVRRDAVQQLAHSDPKNLNYPEVLLQITRLRRLCCHPKLVLPDTDVLGSKPTVFTKLLDDLLEAGHKTLVFSQFVGHLQLIRDILDQRETAYQYLDGSTPPKKRQEAIDSFQNGEGDVFLISLKAGGTGLNLTAASYVIHMDPWWNPAVEDQASDRAHRIGQENPVTVYRLIMRQTIEEKISALHQRKRALADSILEGGDLSGKMSAEALLQLIQDQE